MPRMRTSSRSGKVRLPPARSAQHAKGGPRLGSQGQNPRIRRDPGTSEKAKFLGEPDVFVVFLKLQCTSIGVKAFTPLQGYISMDDSLESPIPQPDPFTTRLPSEPWLQLQGVG